MNKIKKIHFIGFIDETSGDGFADCGRLIKDEQNYDEDVSGRDKITCKNCLKVAKAETAYGFFHIIYEDLKFLS